MYILTRIFGRSDEPSVLRGADLSLRHDSGLAFSSVSTTPSISIVPRRLSHKERIRGD